MPHHVLRLNQALYRLQNNPAREDDERQSIYEGREDFESTPPKRTRLICWAVRQFEANPGQRKCTGIGEHVCSVREQSE